MTFHPGTRSSGSFPATRSTSRTSSRSWTNPESGASTEEGVIYFWPPGGSLRSSDELVVPALFSLIDMDGASWLRLSGFTFIETMDGDNTHHLGIEGAGAM